MSQTTILVIDDSATIRRLVDTHLSQAGYNVVLAATAEEGVQFAADVEPDLIVLDHQLPGTTGFQVCQQLLESPELARIPVVVSSTLRKKAYVEYTDASNVVDLLPKPFAPELLLTTVANALDTGKMIVESQSGGSAVPEVIDQLDEAALSGSFQQFRLREVLDFLNNAAKQGVLEIETEMNRVSFFLDRGRLQAVSSTGVDPQEIIDTLPEALQDLAPMVGFTVGGRFTSEVDGLVQLLDKKVLDERLLRKLLRHQAAILTRRCFHCSLRSFRFDATATAPPLFRKLPLDISLVALLVDGALGCDESELPEETEQTVYSRSAVRGQNLDRAGLDANDMKVLGQLGEPATSQALAERLRRDHSEIRRVLYGMALAELVEMQDREDAHVVYALEHEPKGAQTLRGFLAGGSDAFSGRVVRDQLGLQLLLKRNKPDAILLAVDSDEYRELATKLKSQSGKDLEGVRWIAISADPSQDTDGFDATLHRPYKSEDVIAALHATSESQQQEPQPAGASL
ncbi:MAG: response regulator [Planctomycetaceae bacterium]